MAALRHNSTLADSEPEWGNVDKTRLPRQAFADRGEEDKKSTWRFPHHWMEDGGGLDENGVYTTGTMYLHEGGLNAAWSAAHGGRSGEKASGEVISHLSSHRRAIGADEENQARGGAAREVFLVQGGLGSGEELDVDRGAGVIRNVAILTGGLAYPGIGEAFEVDEVMLKQVMDSINAKPQGPKTRITHPELEGGCFGGLKDPILRQVGRCRNARLAEAEIEAPSGKITVNQVRGEMHLGAYAKNSPSGDLWTYLLDVAEQDPAAIGISIRFIRAEYVQRENAPPLGRVHDVIAVDFVGEPGGNPHGLLSAAGTKDELTRGDGAPRPPFQPRDGDDTMKLNEKQRKYLTLIGLATDAGDEQVTEFLSKLTEDQKLILEALSGGTGKKKDAGAAGDDPPSPSGASAGDAVQLSAADRKKIEEETLKADRERRTEILALAKQHGMPEGWAVGLADRDATVTEVQHLIGLADTMRPLVTGAGRVDGGQDTHLTSLGPAISDAILMDSGVPLYTFDRTGRAERGPDGKPALRKAHERAEKFRGLPLMLIGRHYLKALGLAEVDYLPESEVLDLVMNPRLLASKARRVDFLAMATSDFPFILADSFRKTIRAMYADLEPTVTWPLWCGRQVNPDYKEVALIALSEAPDLLERPEGAPVRYATLKESREKVAVTGFARGLRFTQRMIKNDDRNVFAAVPRLLVQAARRKEDDLPFAVLTANDPLADQIDLFDAAGHYNLAAGADLGAPTVATLTAGYTAMGIQKGSQVETDGDGGPAILDIEPVAILVPKRLQVTTQVLMSSAVDPAKTTQVPNPFANRMKVIGSGRLDRVSPTAWYLAGDPNGAGGGVVLAFLQGEEAPIVRNETDFDTNDLKIVIEHKLGAKASDFRGLYCNPGA